MPQENKSPFPCEMAMECLAPATALTMRSVDLNADAIFLGKLKDFVSPCPNAPKAPLPQLQIDPSLSTANECSEPQETFSMRTRTRMVFFSCCKNERTALGKKVERMSLDHSPAFISSTPWPRHPSESRPHEYKTPREDTAALWW